MACISEVDKSYMSWRKTGVILGIIIHDWLDYVTKKTDHLRLLPSSYILAVLCEFPEFSSLLICANTLLKQSQM